MWYSYTLFSFNPIGLLFIFLLSIFVCFFETGSILLPQPSIALFELIIDPLKSCTY
jgi:hypothetical protein